MKIFNLVTTDQKNNEWILRSNEAVRKLTLEERQVALDACQRHNARIYNRPFMTPRMTSTERYRYNLAEFKALRDQAKDNLNNNIVFINNTTLIEFDRVESKDWHYYAKSYKFPKVSIENKATKIQFIRGEIIRSVRIIRSQRESNRIEAVAFLVKTEGVEHNAPMAIRLNKSCDAKLERVLLGCELWVRSVSGVHIDYVARCGKITYHAQTRLGAISGIKAKIKAKSNPSKIITIDLCKSLNFCDAGINQFIEDAGLSGQTEISLAEMKRIVKAKSLRAKYASELSLLGV